MKKKVTFIAQVYFLDAALEYIKVLATTSDLHVVIQLSEESLKANILNLDVDLRRYEDFVDFKTVMNEWGLVSLEPYFCDCISVNFLIFKSKRSLSLDSAMRSLTLFKFLRNTKSEFYHFDEYSLRLFCLLPILFFVRKNIILNVHDPIPHLGEAELKKFLLNFIIFRIFQRFVVFSSHSKMLLNRQLDAAQKTNQLPLLTYTIYRSFLSSENIAFSNNLTYIGRISEYKGISVLVDSIGEIQLEYPNQVFCIAGKPHRSYKVPNSLHDVETIKVILKHLSNFELVDLVSRSKAIICPYIEATQSGVIMMAYALGKPVIVTNVGGLPEYVAQNTGLVCEPNSESLSIAIKRIITSDLVDRAPSAISLFSENLIEGLKCEIDNIYI